MIIIKNSSEITIKNNTFTCKCGEINNDLMKCAKCGKDLIVITGDLKVTDNTIGGKENE